MLARVRPGRTGRDMRRHARSHYINQYVAVFLDKVEGERCFKREGGGRSADLPYGKVVEKVTD